MNNEVIAYCIMESFSDPQRPKDLSTIKNDLGFWTVRFYAHLQDFNNKNRNRRIYTDNAMLPALQTSELNELMRKKAWMGELDHPTLMGASEKDAMARITKIEQKNASHFILNLDINKHGVSGWIESLPLGRGKEFGANIICGSEPAFSLRALAKVIRQGDHQLINTPPKVITYDAVILPSHVVAYRDINKPISLIKGSDISIVRESYEILEKIDEPTLDYNDRSFQIFTESVNSFVKLESSNIKLVSNEYEISTENMVLTEDMKHVIIQEGNEKYMVKVEEKVSKIVNEAMAKFLD